MYFLYIILARRNKKKRAEVYKCDLRDKLYNRKNHEQEKTIYNAEDTHTHRITRGKVRKNVICVFVKLRQKKRMSSINQEKEGY